MDQRHAAWLVVVERRDVRNEDEEHENDYHMDIVVEATKGCSTVALDAGSICGEHEQSSMQNANLHSMAVLQGEQSKVKQRENGCNEGE